MNTLHRFLTPSPAVPAASVWYLSDLGEAKGTQELGTRQSPQRLKALREHALIESAVSSNRIEGTKGTAPASALSSSAEPFCGSATRRRSEAT